MMMEIENVVDKEAYNVSHGMQTNHSFPVPALVSQDMFILTERKAGGAGPHSQRNSCPFRKQYYNFNLVPFL